MNTSAEIIGAVSEPHWTARTAFPVVSGIFAASQVALAVSVHQDWTWVSVLLVLISSHFMHGILIAFHEASHGHLRKNRFLNDLDGILIGAFSFISFTLYRAAHQTHHMHLATERDEELWPFVQPGIARWKRVLAAILELCFGTLFTPAIFMRTFLRKNSPIRSRKVRRRIWFEIAVSVALWTTILTFNALTGSWKYFIWMYLAPALIAGNLQSWRKYIEHVGMAGATPNSATRSIVSPSWAGKLLAYTLLHEPFHGVHHQHAGLTHAEIPQYADDLEPREEGDVAPFPSYRHALAHLFRSLADPRVGPQWNQRQTYHEHDRAAELVRRT